MDWNLLWAYLIIVFVLGITYANRLNVERQVFTASLRGMLQMLALSFILARLFALQSLWLLIPVYLVMLVFAAYSAISKTEIAHGFGLAFVTLGCSSIPILLLMGVTEMFEVKLSSFIPLIGMVLGNSLNVYSLALNHLKTMACDRRALVESKVALGSTLKFAMLEERRESIRTALIPILNNLEALGIVFIPGLMAGMLIAGVDPLKAATSQLAIMFMLTGVSVLTGFFATLLTFKAAVQPEVKKS